MAAVARHDMRDAFRHEAGSVAAMLIALLRPTSAIAAASRDAATARSLASAGLLGLFGLPVLMLASLLLEAPLAGPAAISLGYLAAAAALERGRPRRAAGWIFAVLTGLVLWMLIAFAVAGQTPSGAGLAAIVLAPLFAAAPTVTRRLVQPQRGRRDDAVAKPDGAHGSTGAPTDRNGGSAEPDAGGERARAVEARAVRACEATAPCGPMRAAASAQPHPGPEAAPSAVESRPPCDLDDAIGFALRHLGPQARARGITLSPGGETPVLAAGDRQLCRKLVMALLREALSASRPRAEIRIATRAAKGFVLLQVTSMAAAREGSVRADWTAPAPVRDMAEVIGASVVFERSGDAVTVSLRLAPAGARMRQSPGA